MSVKNSKFSGIFAQAREREAVDSEEKSAEIEAPIASKSADEKPQASHQNTPESAANIGKIASKKASATPKTPAASRVKAELSPAKTPAQMLEIAAKIVPEKTANGRTKGKRSDPNFTQITAYISKNTHQNVKMALLNEGQKREISELIEDQLAAWLTQNDI